MSESELLAHANEWLNGGIDSVALYLSVLFAYFVAAHLAGASLTRTQLWIVATIYSLIMMSGLVALYTQFYAIERFFGALEQVRSEFVPPVPEGSAWAVLLMYGAAFVASHLYMAHCRGSGS